MTKIIANAGASKVATLPLAFPCLPEALDEVRMSVDRRRHAGGAEDLPSPQGLPAPPHVENRPGGAYAKGSGQQPH